MMNQLENSTEVAQKNMELQENIVKMSQIIETRNSEIEKLEAGYNSCVEQNNENLQINEQLRNEIADGEKYKLFLKSILKQLADIGALRWFKTQFLINHINFYTKSIKPLKSNPIYLPKGLTQQKMWSILLIHSDNWIINMTGMMLDSEWVWSMQIFVGMYVVYCINQTMIQNLQLICYNSLKPFHFYLVCSRWW